MGNTIRVKLSNSNGSNIRYRFTNKYISLESIISLNLNANKYTCNLGSNVEYALYVCSNGNWSLVKDFSSSNTFLYKSSTSVSY